MRIPSGPVFVDPLPVLVSGVDFLGLGAVNERLIAHFLPGISNATRYMRVYSVMTWMAWRFDEHFRSLNRGLSVTELDRRFRRFREKVELLFTWGNLDHAYGIVGSRRRFPTSSAPTRLSFKDFGSSKVSWLDAALYGPSMKVNNGLGFLEPRVGSTLGPSASGVQLALAMDAVLQRSRNYDWLCDLSDDMATRKIAVDFGERWSVTESTRREREIFAAAFAPAKSTLETDPDGAARCSAVRLIYSALERCGGTATVDEVRSTIVRGIPTADGLFAERRDENARAMWTALQVRQLQRLCHEALLRWIELLLLERPAGMQGQSAHELAAFCTRKVSERLELTADQPLSAVTALVAGTTKCRGDTVPLGGASVDVLAYASKVRAVREIDRGIEELPAMALHGLTIAAVQAASLAKCDLYRPYFRLGQRERLSLDTLVELFRDYQDRPLSSFVELLIESCTIGQHLATAAARLEPGKNKYRFVPSDDGLRLLIAPKQLTGLGTTPDRLETGMSLMADCGLLRRHDPAGEYGLPE
jgi:hypothetical protein